MESTVDTANLIKGIIGSLVRFAFAGAVGWMVKQGLISQEQATALIPAIILGVITVAWALWRKYAIQKRIAVALSLPANSSPARLDEAVKNS